MNYDKEFLKNKIGKTKTSFIILSVAIGIGVTFLIMLLLSVIMLMFNINDSFSAPFATVSLAVGSFASAFYSARKVGSRGYLVGLIVGVISFLVVMLISLLVSKDSISVNTLFHLVIVMISSLIGGIFGVNTLVKSRKYI